MALEFFANPAAVKAYVESELLATLRDDLSRMESDERQHYTDEDRAQLTAKIADIEAMSDEDLIGDVADFLAELIDCYSRNGEFNNLSAPLGTIEIREKATDLAKRLGVQFPEDDEEEDAS